MYHPSQKEMILECFDTQLLAWLTYDESERLLNHHKEKYQYMAWLYASAVEQEPAFTPVAFRRGREVLRELFNHDNIIAWMDTDELVMLNGEKIKLVISGEAVLNYLKQRNISVDFIRDKLEVFIEFGKVLIKVTDKVSGGTVTSHSDLDIFSFENQYGGK